MKQLAAKPSKWNVALKSLGAILPAGALALGLVFSFNAGAESPTTNSSKVVVTPTNTQGWSTADTRPGGAVNFINDVLSPYPSGALQLTTDATNEAKAQYMHEANVPLSGITELNYSTKQVSGPAVADASYQLVVDLNGTETPGGETTLVYEPYWNGAVIPGTWQSWDNVADGQFWSSKTFTDGTCSVVNGAGGPPFYTLSQLQTTCPGAVVTGFGVNVGTYNPGYDVEVDDVSFNGTTYDFEASQSAADAKEACKNGGYQVLVDNNGNSYKNQGQCVADMVSSSHSAMHRE
jgi:hypothetical protein